MVIRLTPNLNKEPAGKRGAVIPAMAIVNRLAFLTNQAIVLKVVERFELKVRHEPYAC